MILLAACLALKLSIRSLSTAVHGDIFGDKMHSIPFRLFGVWLLKVRSSIVRFLFLPCFILGLDQTAQGAVATDAMVFDLFAQGTAPVPVGKPIPFEFAAADLELDGDTDLIVNWHLNGVELYLNQDKKKFSRLPRAKSGLYHQGNVSLFAQSEEIMAVAKSSPGIYLWRDPLIFGNWNIFVVPREGADNAVELVLRSNELIEGFQGVDGHELFRDSEFQARNDAWARVRLEGSTLPRHIRFKTSAIGSNIQITKNSSQSFFLGRTFLEKTADRVSLRMPDPHAMAWVNVVASEHPDLFVVRGGNRGRLNPPFEAKRNRLFVAAAGSIPLFNLQSDSLLPVDYGRGRSVAWVDINGDKRNELYIGNKTSSNAFLVFDKALNSYQDLSSRFGLALPCGDAFTWLDLNADSYDDLLFVTCYGSVAVAINDRGREFSIGNAEDYGIVLGELDGHSELFDSTSLNAFDYDADGDLDVIVSGLGKKRYLKIFRNFAGRFIDVTETLGLDSVSAGISIAVDVDTDGYLDLVFAGRRGLEIYRNKEGKKFLRAEVDLPADMPDAPPGFESMAVADFDGDGLKEIVLGSKGFWAVLRNRSGRAGNVYQVVLKEPGGFEPVGTVVQAHYASGKKVAQRYGTAELNGLSQFLFPLTFNTGKGDDIEYFTLASPGSTEMVRVELTDERVILLD